MRVVEKLICTVQKSKTPEGVSKRLSKPLDKVINSAWQNSYLNIQGRFRHHEAIRGQEAPH